MADASDPQPTAEKDTEWVGCAHCGQTLPHEGTSWREAYRCRLFQRIAEQAWDEGFDTCMGGSWWEDGGRAENPYSVTPADG